MSLSIFSLPTYEQCNNLMWVTDLSYHFDITTKLRIWYNECKRNHHRQHQYYHTHQQIISRFFTHMSTTMTISTKEREQNIRRSKDNTDTGLALALHMDFHFPLDLDIFCRVSAHHTTQHTYITWLPIWENMFLLYNT